ncbi:MAG: FAD-binding protein [Rhizobiales bacterium]|nr:FAD-binding protein [Hyphomicrobiales bacterium]
MNCSGIARLRDDAMEPVLARAMADGLVRRHALRGIDVDDSHAVIGRDGMATPGLYAIGTLAGGHFFESAAVPELAAQAARLARALAIPAAA